MSKVQVVWFRDLVRWDIKSNFSFSLQSRHRQVLFEEFLSQVEVEYEMLNPNKDYKILGVRSYGLGVYHNRIARGNTLITKTTRRYQKIQKGNLFWCKVDTKNGAFGVTLDEHIGYYASHNMIQAKIDTSQVDLLFLQYLFSCKFFQQFLDSQVAGTTNRQYISFKELLKIKIPLPPLEIQKEIVAKVERIKAQIKALQEEEKRLKNEIEAYIYIALGLQKPKALARQKVFIVRFKDLTRWDTRHNQSFATNLKNAKSHTDSTTHEADENPAIAESANHSNAFSLDHKALLDSTPTPPPQGWEVKTLGDICETNIGLIYSPTNISNNEMGIVVLRSNNIQNGKIIYDDIIRVKDVAISPNKIAQKGDLLMCVRNGSEGLVGKTAMIEKDGMSFGAFMAIIRSKYNKFLYHFFQLDFFRKSVMQSRTSGINQISQNDIKNFKIPLPPLAVQEQIVMQVEALQSEIKGIDNELNALEQKRLALIQHYLSATNEKERES